MKILLSLISNPRLIAKYATKIAIAFMIFKGLSIVKDISSSGFKGDFSLIDRTKDGKLKIGTFSAKKTLPEKTSLNMVTYNQSILNGTRNINYKRHIIHIYPWHVYFGGGIIKHDTHYDMSVGITLTF